MISFHVFTKPLPKARPRFSRFTGRTYTPTTTRRFENEISFEARKHFKELIIGAVQVKIIFNFIRAKSNKSPLHVIRPDLDNLIKGVLDGLNGIAFKDDCQVVNLQCEKQYAEHESIDIYVSAYSKP
jgi:Holliday junction resolvase RusA-like endonuclease